MQIRPSDVALPPFHGLLSRLGLKTLRLQAGAFRCPRTASRTAGPTSARGGHPNALFRHSQHIDQAPVALNLGTQPCHYVARSRYLAADLRGPAPNAVG